MGWLKKKMKKKREKGGQAHHGPCFVEGCKTNGSLMHHCKICEAIEAEKIAKREARRAKLPNNIVLTSAELERALGSWGSRWRKKPKPPFTIQFCGHPEHVQKADMAIKKHVLLKHPAVIPAYIASKLLGRD